MPQLRSAMPAHEVGILFSYDQEYAISIQPHHPHLGYANHLMTYYKAFHRGNIPVDFVPTNGHWSSYKALIAPLQYLNCSEWTQNLLAYAEQGGALVLTMRAGVKNLNNNCLTDAELPVGFTEAAGLVVDEYDCLREIDNSVSWAGTSYACHKWCDIPRVTTAETLAVYENEFYAGTAAITRNAYGKGCVYYVGTEMGDELAIRFAEDLTCTAKLRSLGATNAGVELVQRSTQSTAFLFALNHTGAEQPLKIASKWQLIVGKGDDNLAPYEGRIYCSAR